MQPIPKVQELMQEPVNSELQLMAKKIRYPNKNRKAMRELLAKTQEEIALGINSNNGHT